MKKTILIILLSTICLGFMGCNKQAEVPETDKIIKATPISKEKSEPKEETLGDVKADPNNKVKLHKEILKSLSTAPKTYKIQDKKFIRKNHKGKFEVHYPVLIDKKRDLTAINSVILGRVIEELPLEMEEDKLNISLDYKVTIARNGFISILFEGYCNSKSAAHPMNLSYTINYDMNKDALLSFYDVYDNDSFIEMIHGAMKKQLEPDLLKGYELLKAQEIENQIYDKQEGFYFDDQKIYVRFIIPAGAQYNGYVSFIYR